MNYRKLLPAFILLAFLAFSFGVMRDTARAAIIAQVNFQDAPTVPPAGYLADSGDAYGPRNGQTYGWVIPGTTSPISQVAEGRNRGTPADVRLATLMHMQRAGAPNGPGAWEFALPAGNYNVTVSVGDATAVDSVHRINIEGVNAIAGFAPVAGNLFLTAAMNVNVIDGRLTIDAIGGINTKINYVIIQDAIGVTRPAVIGVSPANGSVNADVNTDVIATLALPNAGLNFPSVNVNTVYLYPSAGNPTTDRVPVTSVGTSGGGDSLVLSPAAPLNPNTNYTFVVTNGVVDDTGAQMIPFQSTFTTGGAGGGPTTGVSFTKVDPGAPVSNMGYLSLVVWNNRLYASRGDGAIYHWAINPTDGTLSDQRVINNLAGRIIIGMEFDPASGPNTPIIWVTHNAQPYTPNAPHFSAIIGRLQGTNVGQAGENWTYQDYVTGLPRSYGDHMTNSLKFGPDGALYVVVGGISAMGMPSGAWGNRSEVILSAAVLRVDVGILNTMVLPVNVATGIPTTPTTLPDANNFALNDPGLAANGLYNPQAPGAPVTLYATGIRNAYDLVWHSNGSLYVPANGSAGPAPIPQMPANFATLPQCQNRIDGAFGAGEQFVTNASTSAVTQHDYLFRVVQGGYYGHPNTQRCEWIQLGGNPTAVLDPGQTGNHYPIGTLPDRNYRGFAYDFGLNISPNGAIEYKNTTNFGGQLAGRLLVTRWSAGDDIIALTVNGAGTVTAATTGIPGMGGFSNPLDIIEDPNNGNLYVIEFPEQATGANSRITLLRANAVTGIPNIVVNPAGPVSFSAVRGTTSANQTVTITNNGTGDLIISTIGKIGLDPTQFNVNPPGTPLTLAPNASANITVNFAPPGGTAEGVKVANIIIESNDPDTPTLLVELRGLATTGTGNQNEPSLQAIINSFGYTTNVGDPDVDTTPIGNGPNVGDYPGPITGEEVSMQTFVAANPAQPVTFQVIASYAVNGNPPVIFGYHTPGSVAAANRTELFRTLQNQDQTLNPGITGTLQFNPGTTPFALYSQYPPAPWNGRISSTQDTLNTWDAARPHKARVFPLRGSNGLVVPNAYIIGYEEYTQGWDYNDIVVIVRNVMPPPINAGGVIRFENLDWTTLFASNNIPQLGYLNRWLTFQRIRAAVPNNGGTVMNFHNQVTLRIHNDSTTQDLIVTNLAISNLTQFFLPNGENPTPANPLVIPPSGAYDLLVEFRENAGTKGVRIQTLTVTSSASNEPSAPVTLAGGYMERDEGTNELEIPEIMPAFNFLNNTGWSFGSQYIARGEEVLQPTWTRANTAEPIYVRQLSAYHGCCTQRERFTINGTGGGTFYHDETYAQSLLPSLDNNLTAPAQRVYNTTGNFTVNVDGANSNDGVVNPMDHFVRFWPVRLTDGTLVPNTYFIMFDYDPGAGCATYIPAAGSCDYNDNTYLITNIRPLTVSTDMTVAVNAVANPGLPNQDITITVSANNVSTFIADNVNVNINLGAALGGSIVSVTPTQGTCNTGANITCNFGGVSGSQTASVAIVVNTGTQGTFPITAAVTTTTPETSTANNNANMDLLVQDPANLPGIITIIKDALPDSADTFTFNTTGGLGTGTFTVVDDGVPPSNFSLAANFQLAGAPVPAGYVEDNGAAYTAARGYGWVNQGTTTPVNATGEARDRNRVGIAQELDTIMHMQRAGGVQPISWIADVPNGVYDVTVSVGDQPTYDSVHRINVNGINVINNFISTFATEYGTGTATITVTNGRIVVDAIGGNNTKINYIRIVPQATTPANTQVFNNVIPGTYNVSEVVPAGWNLVNANCIGGDFTSITNGVSITLDPAEDITCTFTNSQVNGPAIDIQKTPDTQSIVSGANADFTITVTNIGTVPLTNVVITDPLVPACNNVIPTLPLSGVASYTCTLANVTADFVNTANVSATAPDTSVVTDTDTANVTMAPTGGIEITKDADQTVAFNGTANFTITVTNIGAFDLTNVVVTDALVPTCDNTFANLAIGATQTYTCDQTNVTTSFVNTATVTATLPDTTTTTDSDTATVTVPATAAATFDLTADSPFVINGGTATFTFTFENTGNVPLTAPGSTPTICSPTITGGDTNSNGIFDPGEIWVGTCSVPNVTTDITNTYTIVFSDGVTPITLTDSASVTVVTTNAPAIAILKDADQLINSGDTANFTISVTNIGNADLTNVTVTDPLVPTCNNNFATLAIGETQTYTCAQTNVTASFTNTANVVGTTPTNTQVNASDTANVTVFLAAPSITINKTPDTQTIGYGGTATFTIRVENNGNVDLTNVGVIDALTATCNNTIGALTIGQVVTYTCNATNVIADFTNTAVVSGTTPTNATINDTDDAAVVVQVIGGINIEKTPDTQTAQPGATVNFVMTVTNTGNSPLSNVTVTDPICTTGPTLTGGDANTDGILQTTETWVYSCDVANALVDFTNTATAEGTAPDTTVVNDTDTATVDVLGAPGISIDKSPNVQIVQVGGTANFVMTVTNTGDLPLSNITVTDPVCTTGPTLTGGDTNTDGILQVTEAWTYDCAVTPVNAPFNNTATVTGTAPDTTVVTANDIATVSINTVNAPAIALDKTPAFASVDVGTPVNFVITISNIGVVPLNNVVVTDDQCDAAPVLTGGDTNTDGILQTTETWTYTCGVASVVTGFTGTSTVTADDGAATNVTASDTSVVTINGSGAPVIALDNSPDVQTVNSGGTANFVISVSNPGTVPLQNLVVTDPLCAAAPVYSAGDLNTDNILQDDEIWTYNCSTLNVTQPFTNTASVIADDGLGNNVTASDSVVVIVNGVVGNAPSIDLMVTPNQQSVLQGDTATFTVFVINNGNVDLDNVIVTDVLSPAYANCGATFPTLVVNDVQTYNCSVVGVSVDFSNTFNVVGTHTASGVNVFDTDVAQVTVVTNGTNPPPVSDNGGQNIGQSVTAFDPFITKIADPPFAIPGEAVTFTFYVSNPGSTPAQNVVAIDPVPADVEILSATGTAGNVNISGQDVIFSIATLQPGETVTVTIETRVRDSVSVPFNIVNEVCMNADNMPQQRCDTASVISVTSLPSTGETPFWSVLLRAIMMMGGALVVTLTTYKGYAFINNLRNTSA